MKKIRLGILLFICTLNTHAMQAFDPVPINLNRKQFIAFNNQLPKTVTLYMQINVTSGALVIQNVTGNPSKTCPNGLFIPSVETRICVIQGPIYFQLAPASNSGKNAQAQGSYQVIVP